MTPHYLAELLRDRCYRLRAKHGEVPIDLSDTPDSEIIDYWNDTDGYADEEKLPPRQLSRAIARCETLEEFEAVLRCPALADGGYLMFRPGRSAVLTTLLDKRYFMPPAIISRMVEMAVEQDDWNKYLIYKKIIRKECRRFFKQHEIVDFDIMVPFYYSPGE